MTALSPAPVSLTEAARVAVVRAARRPARRRHLAVLVALVAVLVGLLAACTLAGSFPIGPGEAISIIGGRDLPAASFILMQVKLPQATEAILAGLAFGTAGALFQETLRNPLASPDLLGVSQGASAAGVIAIVGLGLSGLALSAAALIGAIAVAVMIRLLAGRHATIRLVLAGVTIAAAMLAVIEYVFTRADTTDAQIALQWLTGSLDAADWPTVRTLALGLAVLLPFVALTASTRHSLALGPELSAGLGVRRRHGDVVLGLGVLLAGLGVAATGPVTFVAFAAGPIARALNGGRATVAGSALAGAVIVLGASYPAAYAFPQTPLPVGAVTGAFGAPFLLWLLASGRTERRV
jgi:iron complex transport system permease protein